LLRFEGVEKSFGDIVALAGCSFEVEPGQMVGFLGPNGAGKTTSMRTVFGLVTPDAGAVTWGGAEIDHADRLGFGYMPEERGLYPKMGARDQVVYFGRLHGLDRATAERAADRWLDELGLEDRAGSGVDDLSHGNQQRVQLAVALAHDPELLILDEPFSGLDPIAAETMAGVLAARAAAGAAVLFSSHQLDVVEGLCEDVVIIAAGRIVASGDVMELRNASRHRIVEVVVSGVGTSWVDGIVGIEIIERHGDRVRFRTREDAGVGELAARAEAAGTVTTFSFEPPRLSDVFREVVGA
jgi:ABC-2 type transport system ATP-binding protein